MTREELEHGVRSILYTLQAAGLRRIEQRTTIEAVLSVMCYQDGLKDDQDPDIVEIYKIYDNLLLMQGAEKGKVA